MNKMEVEPIIYHFMNPNPFVLVIILCPFVSVVFGFILALLRTKAWIAPAISFLLPLIYVTTDWKAFSANIDAWMFWGIIYALIAYIAGHLVSKNQH
ncbi:hypothetical protein [Paenibacillus sp. 481]|uniref:hypothetical protein n=1 Tax=Paenibacillus sp. 481 TaxID=2835869 RepID=UPI001E604B94|nr:hypothetical protein [Paenibacillus sp. 481]UHA74415.1 hypothetical protein KIK04_04720 [Paenibacillus sp. 481]